MSKLLERLKDPGRSGVYRAGGRDAILECAHAGSLQAASVSLRGAADKAGVLAAIAEALAFPAWFGRNWDALEDCLTDLGWREGGVQVLLFEDWDGVGAGELKALIDVLGAAAAFWAGERTPFFAVFVDPARRLALQDLYRGA